MSEVIEDPVLIAKREEQEREEAAADAAAFIHRQHATVVDEKTATTKMLERIASLLNEPRLRDRILMSLRLDDELQINTNREPAVTVKLPVIRGASSRKKIDVRHIFNDALAVLPPMFSPDLNMKDCLSPFNVLRLLYVTVRHQTDVRESLTDLYFRLRTQILGDLSNRPKSAGNAPKVHWMGATGSDSRRAPTAGLTTAGLTKDQSIMEILNCASHPSLNGCRNRYYFLAGPPAHRPGR